MPAGNIDGHREHRIGQRHVRADLENRRMTPANRERRLLQPRQIIVAGGLREPEAAGIQRSRPRTQDIDLEARLVAQRHPSSEFAKADGRRLPRQRDQRGNERRTKYGMFHRLRPQ
jgi:hypothetical protein